MRVLLICAVLLVAAAPADASTLDYVDDTYQLQGTPERDHLSVVADADSVTFTDHEGTLTGTAELPAGCESVAANAIRCTLMPRKKTLVDGGEGDDELVGSRLEEFILGGDGNDRVRPGLGADYVEGGDGIVDTLDHSQDERSSGVRLDGGEGPDSGDSFNGFERLIGTRHRDSIRLPDNRVQHEIETLGGNDFVDVFDSYARRARGDRVECGPGVDLYSANYTDEDIIGCEEAGRDLGQPVAGHLQVTYEARYLPGRQLSFTGFAECRAGGAACVLEIAVKGFGRTVRKVRPGRGAPVIHVMSRRAYARASEKGKVVRAITFTLNKRGFPASYARLARDIAP